MASNGNQVRVRDSVHFSPSELDTLASISARQGWWRAWEDLNLRPHPYQWSWAWRPTPAHENGSTVGPLGRPLLRGGGERRVDRISDLRVCSGHGSFSTQAYSRDAFKQLERETASTSVAWS